MSIDAHDPDPTDSSGAGAEPGVVSDAAAPVPMSAEAATVLSVDAMGGDKGAQAVVDGVARFLAETPDASVLLHGPEGDLAPMVARAGLGDRVTIVSATQTVAMTDKPSHIMRNGKDTSMWSAVDAVRDGRAGAVVSCGNTGALMAVAMLRLRRAAGVDRPAIACLWPSHNPSGFNVMLDVGADIRADAHDLMTFAMMGASYARNGLGLARPRVGLLNVGTEEHKGRAELKAAQDMMEVAAPLGEFEYVGFVEGGDLPSDRVDVIVTDGFTGNIALKTGEGTATLVGDLLRGALRSSPLAMIGGLLARGSLRRAGARVDPRHNNGGVFLGLNGCVVKSHGSADATGVASALRLAYQLSRNGFTRRVAARLAAVASLTAPGVAEDAAEVAATPAADAGGRP